MSEVRFLGQGRNVWNAWRWSASVIVTLYCTPAVSVFSVPTSSTAPLGTFPWRSGEPMLLVFGLATRQTDTVSFDVRTTSMLNAGPDGHV
jgi:hypothetical protein